MIKELKVENIIIGKQFENCENYENFIKIVSEKKIKLYIVEAGTKIKIEKNLYFDILWPNKTKIIKENILNNNSLICKLIYKDFSVLYTGDIEEVAEKELLKYYNKNNDKLKSTILKVAHHGSKTSSNMELLNVINPQYALIGVGKDNKFNHPSQETLNKLNEKKCKIYRTDECGEIAIITNGQENCIRFTTLVNNSVNGRL